MNITLSPPTEEQLRSGELGLKLRRYNYGFVGEYPKQEYIRIDARYENGRLLVRRIDPAELSPGEFSHLVRHSVERSGARVLIIDSLNGYMQAMPMADHVTIQLHELLSYLNRNGVLSLMTVAQHGLVGQMNSPADLTYLADTVVLLRYFEQRGRIKKAISVIKKRIGKHEDTLREFRIDDCGIRVGEALEDFEGVLTGVPTFVGKSEKMLRNR